MSAPPQSQDQPPNFEGRYVVERELGRGASAVVYLARDTAHDRPVAIKVLHTALVESLGAARFLREIKQTARLQHPRILAVLDDGVTADGRLFFAMPYMEGGTLRDRLVRDKQLPIGQAVAVAHAVATALAYAHDHGVLHRDVKPENILFAEDGEACLGDFGIARALELGAEGGTTTTGVVRGTPVYMSPEQASAERELDGRTDQYALAIVLYEMLAGVRPFTGATAQAEIAQRFLHAPPAVTQYRDAVTAELAGVVRQALSVTPADRYPTMRAFAGALAGTGLVHSIGPTPPASEPRRALWKYALRRPSASARRALLVVSCIAAAGAAVAMAREIATRDTRTAAQPRASAGDASSGDVLTVRLEGHRDDAMSDVNRVLAATLRRALEAELLGWPEIRVAGPDGERFDLALATSTVPLGDSAQLVVDVRRSASDRTSWREVRVVGINEVAAATTVSDIARSVLLGSDARVAPGAARMPGRSLSALRAYVQGWKFLRAGQLDSSASAFRAARASNPEFAQAALWAAQSGAWADPRDTRSWRPDALAATHEDALDGADSSLAAALLAMSDRDYPTACMAFARAAEGDATGFAGWFGLGECARLDTAVVEAPAGPRFRSSGWGALSSYSQAIDRAPSSELLGALFERVMAATFAVGNRARNGNRTDRNAAPYSALPALDADTLAFFPIPRGEFAGLGPNAVPTTYSAALRRCREIALDLTGRWLRRFPEASEAWFYRALALEYAGRVADGPPETSAVAALDRAAPAAATAHARARIAVARARLALRRLDFAAAASIARAAVQGPVRADAELRATLAPLAALVGAADAFERLSSDLDEPSYRTLPATLADSLRRFHVRAVIGACAGLGASRQRLESMFTIAFAPAELQARRQELLLPLYRDAVTCDGAAILRSFRPAHPIDEVYQAIAAGDHPRARRLLASLRAGRAGASVASISWDYLFAESWALGRLGDGRRAVSQLLSALGDLGSMGTMTLEWEPQAAGFRRALGLLAELASSPQELREVTPWIARYRMLVNASSPN